MHQSQGTGRIWAPEAEQCCSGGLTDVGLRVVGRQLNAGVRRDRQQEQQQAQQCARVLLEHATLAWAGNTGGARTRRQVRRLPSLPRMQAFLPLSEMAALE